MAGRYIKKRKLTWYSNIPIPERYRSLHGGKSKIEASLKTRDEVVALREAQAMAARLQRQWAAHDGCGDSADAIRRDKYEAARQWARSGELKMGGVTQPTKSFPLLPQERHRIDGECGSATQHLGKDYRS